MNQYWTNRTPYKKIYRGKTAVGQYKQTELSSLENILKEFYPSAGVLSRTDTPTHRQRTLYIQIHAPTFQPLTIQLNKYTLHLQSMTQHISIHGEGFI